MPDKKCNATLSEDAMIVRQPIFDRDENVWGYELFINDIDLGCEDLDEQMRGLVARELEQLFALAKNKENTLNCLLIHMSKETLDKLNLQSMDFKELIISLEMEDQDELKGAVDEIQRCNLRVVVEGSNCPVCEEVATNADLIRMNLKGKTPRDIVQFRTSNKKFPGAFLASDIQTWEDFHGTRALGFDYFQGPFFTRPLIDNDKDVPASKIAKLRMLKELNNDEVEVDSLADIISTDVSLSYRLLKYINSAAFGLMNKINSVSQAISLLGLKEIRRWAMMIVMTDMDASPKGGELAYLALQRAKFFESICDVCDALKSENKGKMFLFGLFSNVDALLSYEMEKALADMPIDDEIKAALCGERNKYCVWLDLLAHIETGSWDDAKSILRRMGANIPVSATNYLKASSWAAEQLPNMRH